MVFPFQYLVSPVGNDLSLVDLHFNIIKFFDDALLRADHTRAAEHQTFRYFLSKLTPNAAISTLAGRMPFSCD